jgi:hypothetical protein
MSRDDGFPIGDRSTRTLYDPRLVRAYRKAGLGALVAWDAITDASWAQGDRVTLEDALLPLPYELDIAALREALCDAGLLDDEGRIRDSSWDHWFGPAYDRREARRETGRLGGLRARGQRSYSDAKALLQQHNSTSTPVRPSVPSVPTVPSVPPVARVRARENGSNDQEHDEAVQRAIARLADPATSEGVKEAARLELQRLNALPDGMAPALPATWSAHA